MDQSLVQRHFLHFHLPLPVHCAYQLRLQLLFLISQLWLLLLEAMDEDVANPHLEDVSLANVITVARQIILLIVVGASSTNLPGLDMSQRICLMIPLLRQSLYPRLTMTGSFSSKITKPIQRQHYLCPGPLFRNARPRLDRQW